MGCFTIHREEVEESSGSTKGTRILGWNFRFVFPRRSKPAPESSGSSGESSSAEIPKLQELRVFTLGELKAATKNFSLEKLGEGGFGAVYKGVIKDKEEKTQVAVKKLNGKGQQGQKEWLSEVTYLRMVDHPNLVKLLGFCLEDDERGPQCLLVYEFMPNKGLDSHIFSRNQVLSWERRLQVALGTARGLAYLHEELKPHIIYRDLKAANILLDLEYKPKLSDFGLARGGPDMGATHVTTAPVGTPGYAAPEYLQTGRLTTKSDVWSFGMVLLELVTGRRALDMNRPRSERSLAEWVKPYANDTRRFRRLIDPQIRSPVVEAQAKSLVSLALRCSNKTPKTRPKMSEVVKQLEQIMQLGGAETHFNDVNRSGSVTDISATGSDLVESQEVAESPVFKPGVAESPGSEPENEKGTTGQDVAESLRSKLENEKGRAGEDVAENLGSEPENEKGTTGEDVAESPGSEPENEKGTTGEDVAESLRPKLENEKGTTGEDVAESPGSEPENEKGGEDVAESPGSEPENEKGGEDVAESLRSKAENEKGTPEKDDAGGDPTKPGVQDSQAD